MRRLSLAILLPVLLAAAPVQADQVSALQTVKAQPRVVDAELDTSGNMYVLVKPEKIAWNQYAAAMCSLVKPHQARIFRMRIVEITQATRGKPPASWSRLAEADCGR